MNMIMHGDGHGGIHHHDGLVDVNGVFPDRFDLVLTNPWFGGNVGNDQKVNSSAETRVSDDADYVRRCEERYGQPWRERYDVLRAAADARSPILELFEIGRGKANRSTEIMFVERSLQLLKPGGRLGIVLPDGNLNNPSLAWLRRWCEGRARIDAIVSLPEATFVWSKATVKASVVFLTRFTDADELAWENAWAGAHAAIDAHFDAERDSALAELDTLELKRPGAWARGSAPAYSRGLGKSVLTRPRWAKDAGDLGKAAWGRVEAAIRAIDSRHDAALWAEVRERFDYPVFVAAPSTVGITSTGDTENAANDLPALLTAYAAFRRWRDSGAEPDATPSFPLPFAA